MILVGLLLLCALALSGASAFYSIAGLMAIFAAAPIPIAVMGTTLEVSKLVVASWLYRNWKQIPKLMKGYLTAALVILMFLTSMGIFGFLSKAHLDQTLPSDDITAKLQVINSQIQTEEDNLNAARKTIAQLDEQVNQTLSRTAAANDDRAVSRSIAIRRGQAKERQEAGAQITTSQTKLAELRKERSTISSEVRKLEAEVGPVKYIAALIYGDETDSSLLEKAVRFVILMIVVVFDPLAVVMLMAASWSLTNRKQIEQLPTPSPPTGSKREESSSTKVDPPPPVQTPVTSAIDEPPPQKDQPITSPESDILALDQITPPLEESPPLEEMKEGEEHPAFKPDDRFWRSRPPKTKS